ncbi:MAG TPA: ABC transporter permease [Gemmatimonadaceae bacterium]|nr:ABC transporter permease [Gemmatimonadaceae bacterium]
MSETMLIIKREFRSRVQSKMFVVGTIIFPVFLVALLLISGSSDGGKHLRVAVVDQAPSTVGERFIQLLSVPRADSEGNTYTVDRIAAPLEGVRDSLNRLVAQKALDAYIVLPSNILEGDSVLYRARSIPGAQIRTEVRQAASRAVQGERLEAAGLRAEQVAALVQPVSLSSTRVTAQGEQGGTDASVFIFAYVVAFLIYFMTLFYGISVLRSVLEEKTNRISELMVSSVNAQSLMIGKVIGGGSAAILQVAIWAAFVAIAATQSSFLTQRFGISAQALQVLHIAPATGGLFLLYFILGFFLFAAVFAAMGAAVTSEQEAQSLQMAAILPLIIPLMLIGSIATDPLGTKATVLGLVPFTSPIAMPMRIAAAAIPPAQIALSVVLLALSVVAVSWVAGKIYRVGILSTGKRPSFQELMRWIRTA